MSRNTGWRSANPEKANAIRRRNYAKGSVHATNSRLPWLPEHVELVLTSPLTDREIAAQIKRSVQAIQAKRCALKQ